MWKPKVLNSFKFKVLGEPMHENKKIEIVNKLNNHQYGEQLMGEGLAEI